MTRRDRPLTACRRPAEDPTPEHPTTSATMVGVLGTTVDDVLRYTADFERSYVAVVRGRIKLRVGSIVYVAFSRDEATMGFAFPKVERDALVASAPDVFLMPSVSDLRFQWVEARLDRLDPAEMRELVLDAWGMVVPQFLFRARLERFGLDDPGAEPEAGAAP